MTWTSAAALALLFPAPLQAEGDAASRPAPFARAAFTELTPAAPGDDDAGAWARVRRRHLTLTWPSRVSLLDDGRRATRASAIKGLTPTALEASHALEGDGDEPYDLDAGATLRLAEEEFAEGSVLSYGVGEGEALFDARALHGSAPSLRAFGVALRAVDPLDKRKRPEPSALMVRRGSAYAEGPNGQHLDVYYVRDAAVASERNPSMDNLSIAGAGDRPRRFMRGHRFTRGDLTVVALRYYDAAGGSLRLSLTLPKKRTGTVTLPDKDVAIAVTELSPDPEIGRISERVDGSLRFQPLAEGGARLELALDARMRRIGARDPERLLVFGEFACVPMPIEELTPWLGRYLGGKPSLATFAVPGPYDR